MSSDTRDRALLPAFWSGAGAALVASLILALVDGLAAGGGAIVTVVGLWAVPALAFALYAGAVAVGFRAAFGPGAVGGCAPIALATPRGPGSCSAPWWSAWRWRSRCRSRPR
jgi:hypothetical protein